jgi:hypothetical protein
MTSEQRTLDTLPREAPALLLPAPAHIRRLRECIHRHDAATLANHPRGLVRPMLPGEFWPYAVANCRHVFVCLTPQGHVGKAALPHQGRPPRFILAEMGQADEVALAIGYPEATGEIIDADESFEKRWWRYWWDATADEVKGYNVPNPPVLNADTRAVGAALSMWGTAQDEPQALAARIAQEVR